MRFLVLLCFPGGVIFFQTLDNGHMLRTSKEGEYQAKERFLLNQED